MGTIICSFDGSLDSCPFCKPILLFRLFVLMTQLGALT